jgi:hypothetical protein
VARNQLTQEIIGPVTERENLHWMKRENFENFQWYLLLRSSVVSVIFLL